MEIITFLQNHTLVFYGFVMAVGLTFGSFLNVVIYRLPKMMEREWHSQCRELLTLPAETTDKLGKHTGVELFAVKRSLL
jgi:leader peptidase (prepilin peptidase) / N-methyltransferase